MIAQTYNRKIRAHPDATHPHPEDTTMRAAIVDRYGPPEVVRLADTPTPHPTPGTVLVRVSAAGVNSGDARLRSGRFPAGFGMLARLAVGVRGPRRRILGVTLAGTVEALGDGVTGFAVGDRVAGFTGMRLGAHAELAIAPVASLTHIPDGVSDADACAIVFGGATALWFLRDRADVRPGERVLVIGGSGAVGSAAIQVAARAGAHVTAVTSFRNADLARRLGAVAHIDYARTPIADLSDRFDVVVDTVGVVDGRSGRALLAPGGRLVLVIASLRDTVFSRPPVIAGTSSERADGVADLLALVASGELDPLTTVVGGLAQLPDAYRLIDGGHKVGALVIEPGA